VSMPTTAILALEQYLESEKNSPVRHEMVEGQLFMMADATDRHNIIAGNIFAALHSPSAKSACQIFMSDMKLVLLEDVPIGYYPDVMVVCDPTDRHSLYRTKPCLVIEVSSRDTKRIDQVEKKGNYLRLDSLKAYVLVHQDEQVVELHRKLEDGTWAYEQYQAGESFALPCPETSITLEQIYEGVQ
jgi:Uma2 family endonuclease